MLDLFGQVSTDILDLLQDRDKDPVPILKLIDHLVNLFPF
jgi:hypothetical protein